MDAKFARERERFPLARKYAYFDTPSTGPIPDYVCEAVALYQNGKYLVGGDSDFHGKSTFTMIDETKARFGQMLNCPAADIAFGLNSSQMFSLFSGGLALQPGDNVILTDSTFISMAYAWDLRRSEGIQIKFAKARQGIITPEEIFELVDGRTRVISLNHVENTTGFRHDLERIGAFCRERGIYLAVDAVQSAGVMPIDVQAMNIDFLVGSDYKWLLHFCGVGYAYVSPNMRDTLIQRGAGWMSERERFNTSKLNLDLRADASRYELGYPNAAGIYAVGDVVAHYLALGKDDVARYVLGLADYLYQQIDALDGVTLWSRYPEKNRSGISIITFPDALGVTSEKLKEQGVFASVHDGAPYGAENSIRIGLHYFNNRDDIDRLVSAIKGCRV